VGREYLIGPNSTAAEALPVLELRLAPLCAPFLELGHTKDTCKDNRIVPVVTS